MQTSTTTLPAFKTLAGLKSKASMGVVYKEDYTLDYEKNDYKVIIDEYGNERATYTEKHRKWLKRLYELEHDERLHIQNNNENEQEEHKNNQN